mmetsp:Transcript_42003/g.99694  ORF Transcript_42003/g.99694 Transcript_42003/m.99694 type:complete len:217 (+) Transcript_42003:296-946(+)
MATRCRSFSRQTSRTARSTSTVATGRQRRSSASPRTPASPRTSSTTSRTGSRTASSAPRKSHPTCTSWRPTSRRRSARWRSGTLLASSRTFASTAKTPGRTRWCESTGWRSTGLATRLSPSTRPSPGRRARGRVQTGVTASTRWARRCLSRATPTKPSPTHTTGTDHRGRRFPSTGMVPCTRRWGRSRSMTGTRPRCSTAGPGTSTSRRTRTSSTL